jgi:hypothetical protein
VKTGSKINQTISSDEQQDQCVSDYSIKKEELLTSIEDENIQASIFRIIILIELLKHFFINYNYNSRQNNKTSYKKNITSYGSKSVTWLTRISKIK